MPKRRGSVNPIGIGPVGPGTPPPIHIPGIDLSNGTTFLFFQNKVNQLLGNNQNKVNQLLGNNQKSPKLEVSFRK